MLFRSTSHHLTDSFQNVPLSHYQFSTPLPLRVLSNRSRAAGEKNTAFTFDKVYDVSGLKNTKVHHHDIVIPADAAPGDYHLMVWCTDAAGNQTEVARNIVLSADGGTETEHDHDHE